MRKLNVTDRQTDGQTDGRGALQYLPSRAFGAAGDKKMTFCTLLANQMTVEGQRLFLKLIHNIMLPMPTLSVWDKIMKLKLNVFPSSISLGDKVVKLRTRT